MAIMGNSGRIQTLPVMTSRPTDRQLYPVHTNMRAAVKRTLCPCFVFSDCRRRRQRPACEPLSLPPAWRSSGSSEPCVRCVASDSTAICTKATARHGPGSLSICKRCVRCACTSASLTGVIERDTMCNFIGMLRPRSPGQTCGDRWAFAIRTHWHRRISS